MRVVVLVAYVDDPEDPEPYAGDVHVTVYTVDDFAHSFPDWPEGHDIWVRPAGGGKWAWRRRVVLGA